MDAEKARQWAQSFENKSISELESLDVPEGLPGHFISRWQRARLGAIEIKRAALNAARQTLTQQIAARADQLQTRREPAKIVAETVPAQTPPEHSATEEKREFNSEDRAENLQSRLAAAIARNNEPVPEPTLKSASAPVILERMLPLAAMGCQLSSSAIMVDELVREFRESEFPVHVVCEIVKSMSVLIVANAALGKVVHQFQCADGGNGAEGRRSNAC